MAQVIEGWTYAQVLDFYSSNIYVINPLDGRYFRGMKSIHVTGSSKILGREVILLAKRI